MKAFKRTLNNSTPKQRNYTLSRTDCEKPEAMKKQASPDKMISNQPNWNIVHLYTILKDTKKASHKNKMESVQNNELKAYGLCKLLFTKEWTTYIKNPLDDTARNAFIAKMTNSATQKKYAPPPYGIYFDSMTISIEKI
jgi:hypothetical protein